MDTAQSAILAVIQGITEFLPISSSAHLILPHKLFGWQDQGLMFDVVIHFATLLAVVIYLRAIIIKTTRAFVCSPLAFNQPDTKLAYQIILATIPAVIFGFLSKDFIATFARNELVIASTTLIFGILLIIAHFYKKEQLSIYQLSWAMVILIGLSQALALIPGTSRSGITISVALLIGITAKDSAKFSFLLSIPIILGACILLVKDALESNLNIDWTNISIAFILAFISALITLKLFMQAIQKIGLLPFAIYRLLLALFLFIFAFNASL